MSPKGAIAWLLVVVNQWQGKGSGQYLGCIAWNARMVDEGWVSSLEEGNLWPDIYSPSICLEGPVERREYWSQDNQCCSRGWNWAPPGIDYSPWAQCQPADLKTCHIIDYSIYSLSNQPHFICMCANVLFCLSIFHSQPWRTFLLPLFAAYHSLPPSVLCASCINIIISTSSVIVTLWCL